ncbi:hypothetical protein V8E54_009570 [Elaphomyces granulatus]|jgi:hypothetical protein
MDITLEGPENYHSWFLNIKESVPKDLWKYFDPESADEYNPPETVTFATIRPEATTWQQLSAAELELYVQLHTLYHFYLSQYQRYLAEKAKLRTTLLNTVPEIMRCLLPIDESIRQWISNLQVALQIRRPT